ncbi:MAG: 3-deoxy-7-phosphoheptulonate synthase, partial [Pseudomonadales bacterium]|nr:3-deoxy-7-phosphoheptulonate synthase [Pseudomonadales bacterium]
MNAKTALNSTDDTRILAMKELLSPLQLINEFPITDAATRTVLATRSAIQGIMNGKDDRLVVIVGPCSIHDCAAAF